MSKPQLSSRNIRKAISDIEKMDLASIDKTEISSAISMLITGYKVEVPIFKDRIDIYRGRICEKPLSLQELSYPPKNMINTFGRGNEKKQSMFYGATARSVPFFELNCEEGQKMVLSKWKTNEQLVLNHIGFTQEVTSIINSSRNLNEIYDFVKTTNNFGDLNEMVHEYLGFIFSKPISKETEQVAYRLTSAIAEAMLTGSKFHGLMYPTIQMSGNADNIMLKPEYVDKNLEFVSAEYIEIIGCKGNECNIKVVDSAINTDGEGKLNWSGRPLKWELTEQGQVAIVEAQCDGTWLAKDENGKVIEPI